MLVVEAADDEDGVCSDEELAVGVGVKTGGQGGNTADEELSVSVGVEWLEGV